MGVTKTHSIVILKGPCGTKKEMGVVNNVHDTQKGKMTHIVNQREQWRFPDVADDPAIITLPTKP